MIRRRAVAGLSLVALPALLAAISSTVVGPSAYAAVPVANGFSLAQEAGTDTTDLGSIFSDTLRAPGLIYPDTILPEEWRAQASVLDTLTFEDEDEVTLLPEPVQQVPAGWHTGIWEWDQEGLQSTRAFTLLELLEQVPGVVPLRGGDYGQPSGATAFGVGAGRIRVFRDGVELPPLDGGAVDLSRIGLSGISRVRVERRGGELRVEMSPLQLTDPRPYTLLEVGTGDLSTNLFRGTFGHPNALGGSILVSLDRIDTQGPFRQEPGASFGGHVRHTLFQSDRGGVAWEYRTMTSRRPGDLWPPNSVGRSDLSLHGRYELFPSLLASAFVHRASLDGDPDDEAPPDAEALVEESARTQLGGRLSLDREGWWAEAEAVWNRGPLRPGSNLGFSGGGTIPGLGGVSGSFEREGWDSGSGISLHGRVWSAPLAGFSVFGEVEDGRRGVPLPLLPPEEDAPSPPLSFDDRTYFRAGIDFRWGGLHLGAAGVQVQADSLYPIGLEWDEEGEVLPGGSRNAVEVAGRLPLTPLLNGLSVEGSAQIWDREETWRYTPQESYQASLRFHDAFLESENLEVWLDVGVRGRNAMALPLAMDLPTEFRAVPLQRSWYGFLQIRIVTARLFFGWENFTVREENQDFPDRLLVPTRMVYGVRWTMWN